MSVRVSQPGRTNWFPPGFCYIVSYLLLLIYCLIFPLFNESFARYTSDMSSRDFFKGKRIAVIGLGPQGEMLSDIKFLIKSGAIISVYDLRSESRVKEYINVLREVGLASYICGSIPADDLLDMELIIL